jgi:hypothetical protein
MCPVNLPPEVKDLKELGSKAKDIVAELQELQKNNRQATDAHHAAVSALVKDVRTKADKLKPASKDMARQWIEELRARTVRYEAMLASPVLTTEGRSDLDFKLMSTTAELQSLELEAGTDYSGLLTERETQKIRMSLEEAAEDIKAKKTAAAMIEISGKVADAALFVAGKLARSAVV